MFQQQSSEPGSSRKKSRLRQTKIFEEKTVEESKMIKSLVAKQNHNRLHQRKAPVLITPGRIKDLKSGKDKGKTLKISM